MVTFVTWANICSSSSFELDQEMGMRASLVLLGCALIHYTPPQLMLILMGEKVMKKRAVTLAFIAPREPSHQSNPLCFIPAKMLCQLLPSFKVSTAPLTTYPPPYNQRRNFFNVAPSWIMIPTFRYGPVGRLFLDSSIHIKRELLVLHLKYARSMEGLNSAQDIWGA